MRDATARLGLPAGFGFGSLPLTEREPRTKSGGARLAPTHSIPSCPVPSGTPTGAVSSAARASASHADAACTHSRRNAARRRPILETCPFHCAGSQPPRVLANAAPPEWNGVIRVPIGLCQWHQCSASPNELKTTPERPENKPSGALVHCGRRRSSPEAACQCAARVISALRA